MAYAWGSLFKHFHGLRVFGLHARECCAYKLCEFVNAFLRDCVYVCVCVLYFCTSFISMYTVADVLFSYLLFRTYCKSSTGLYKLMSIFHTESYQGSTLKYT